MKDYLNTIRYCCIYFRTINDSKSNHFSLLLFRYLITKLKLWDIQYSDLQSLESVNISVIYEYIKNNKIKLIEPAHLRIIEKNDESITEQFLLSYIVNHFQSRNEYCL
jgi:hypothetical protein